MADRIRVGVIGLGWPGREHLKGYKASGLAEVVAVCDLEPGLREQVADEQDVPKRYAEYGELLAEEKLDAVSVCLPNFLHKSATVAALEAGENVICEKPPALSAAEAREMADTAKRKGKTLMYALVQRFGSAAQIVREFVDAGELGDIYFGKAGYVRRRGIPIGKGGWFVDKSRSGGGALIDIGVHALDCAWWLMGNPKPVSVSGSAYAHFGHTVPEGVKYDVDDAAFGLIKFENGATLFLEATWALNLPTTSFKQIAGTKGGATLDPLTIYTERNGLPIDITPSPPQRNGFEAQIRHFVECLMAGTEPGPSAEQGVALMQMLDGIYSSASTGGEVRISD